MQVVAPAQLCLFEWCVISAGHFPKKSLGRNLKIGFPLSPPPNHALLLLTHDLTAFRIGWVQAGEVWALRMPSFHMCPKSVCCSLVHRGLEACLHSLPFVFWPFTWAAFLFPTPFRGWYLFVTELYTSFGPFLDCPHFLPYHPVIPTVMTQSCWASLGLPLILSPSGLNGLWFSCLWAPVSLLLFSWASLAHLLSLGFFIPFTNSAFPWAFTNFIELSWPKYFILILEVYGLAINPLLSLFALLLSLQWPIITFLHHILPIGMLFLSFRTSLSPFTSLRPICLFHEPVIHYSCRLG